MSEGAGPMSRHLVDRDLLPLLDAFPAVTVRRENLAELRNRELPFPSMGDHPVSVEEKAIDGPKGAPDVNLRIYRPLEAAGETGCIFHIHGGGYVAGSAREVEFLHRPLAAALRCTIVSVDYRLAPETIFPGALQDCYAALGWTFENAAALRVDPERIGVMGESAGGGLAAALALFARDRDEYRLAFQHLIYPMIDDRTCVADANPYSGHHIWNRASNHFGWSAFLGQKPGSDGISAYAAAARAEDLRGLPPTFIGTAALDLFVDENLDYARRLIRAGVPTELHVWPGAFHGFDLIRGIAVADAARDASVAALRRFLAKD
jgi:triacylglycerol lipase